MSSTVSQQLMTPRPFTSLYVHVPFCHGKCDYCIFYSVAGADMALRADYQRRLATEFATAASHCSPLNSVFIGGGTPTILTSRELEELLCAVRHHFKLTADCEFSVECNPESLTAEKASILAGQGVNRISLGVQSFSPRQRRTLGRRGDVRAIAKARKYLAASGIYNVGMDLIFGIPGQTLNDWCEDVRQACNLDIRHLSTYSLTVEEGSRLARRALRLPSEDLTVDMWEAAGAVASEFGLRRYEVSNLAERGYECRHNLEIWHGGTYIGCGPAAASFDGSRRWTNAADLAAWLAGAEPDYDDLPAVARACEILAFGLRTVTGWDGDEFQRRTGFTIEQLRSAEVEELRELQLLCWEGPHLRPTRRGLLFADLIAERLL